MTAHRLQHLAFLIPGNYADTDPAAGLEATLQVFAQAEALGYDSAWVRQRHLERGVSSAATFLAAATQRTRRIGLGTAVIQMGYENPFRLAEDLATVDVLSGGRLQVGLSAGPPPFGALLGARLFDADPSTIDFSHVRVQRLRDNLAGGWLGDDDDVVESPAGAQRPRLHPQAAGLTQRLWYGGGSLRSAEWAGQTGLNLLVGNVTRGEDTDDFFVAQARQLDRFHTAWQKAGHAQAPRVAVGRVIVPLDSADAATRRFYRQYAEARLPRTRAPQGERRTLFPPDIVGTHDEILEALQRDPITRQATELRLELPYDFTRGQYEQILHDVVQFVAPALGWRPATPSRRSAPEVLAATG